MIDKIYKIKLGLIQPKNKFETFIVNMYEALIGFSPSRALIYFSELEIKGFEEGLGD